MAHVYDHDDPEQMIAVLNRNRQIKMVAAVVGVVLALGIAFLATTAMYSADPVTRALGTPDK